MPYGLRKEGDKTCVYNTRTGETVAGGCHDSRVKALKHQRAMMLNVPDAMTASASWSPPRSYFETPEPSRPTPMTYEDDGRVYGHIAVWGSCHRGFMGGAFEQCVQPPRSNMNYEQYHQGYVQTAEGDRLPIGKITYNTNHAPITADALSAYGHYDNTGTVGAYVRATNGQHGIWVSGVLRPDLDPGGLAALRGNAPSGDWRWKNGNLEMVAALAVPLNGFEQPQLALSASVEGGVSALILPGYCECTEEEVMEHSKQYLRERSMVASALVAAPLTSERRNNLPRSSFAIPEDRAYPIHDRAHARNALARSSGKPEEARVRRAVCRRYPDMCRD